MVLKIKPFIGVTGITSLKQAKAVIGLFDKSKINMNSEFIPMLGYAVGKHGEIDKKFEHYKRYISVEKLAKSVLKYTKDKALNMIHYSPNTETLDSNDVLYILDIVSKKGCPAVKINIPNPAVEELLKIKKAYPDIIIAFQLPLHMYLKSPLEVVDYMKAFKGAFSYLFLDTRKENCSLICKELSKLPNLSLGLNGGTDPKEISNAIPPFISLLSPIKLSLDVESFLRDDKDNLVLSLTESYIQQATELLK